MRRDSEQRKRTGGKGKRRNDKKIKIIQIPDHQASTTVLRSNHSDRVELWLVANSKQTTRRNILWKPKFHLITNFQAPQFRTLFRCIKYWRLIEISKISPSVFRGYQARFNPENLANSFLGSRCTRLSLALEGKALRVMSAQA